MIALTVLEAAALLHCSRARVFQLLSAGDLERAQSAGRETLVLRDSVEAYLRAPSLEPVAKRRRARRAHSVPPVATRAGVKAALGRPGARSE